MTLKRPERDLPAISEALSAGRRLVACLCADWCSACSAWEDTFAALARNHPDDCFVWIDIDNHPDLVAEVDLETLPVLLIQDSSTTHFLGAIQPKSAIVATLLEHGSSCWNTDDHGIREFLMQ